MSGQTPKPRANFPSRIEVRCPADLPRVIEHAAQRQLMTSSEYIRRCVLERLMADGELAGAA